MASALWPTESSTRMTGARPTRSPRSVSGAGDRAWRDSALRRLQRAEEKRKLELCRLRGIGPVDGIVFDVGPVGLADRALGGIGGVRRAPPIPAPPGRGLAFPHHDQVAAHSVRLDDGERAFHHARMIPETAA